MKLERVRLLFLIAFAALDVFATAWGETAIEPGETRDLVGGMDAASLEALRGTIIDVRTRGGGSFRGALFSVGGDRIELVGPEGVISAIDREAILAVEPIDPASDTAEYFQNSASNRLVLMPTGFGMEKGELHVASQEIVAVTASYGVSEHFSLWLGTSIPGALVSLRWSSMLGPRSALSLGTFLGLGWLDTIGIALPYAIASVGHQNRNLSLGGGVPFAWDADGGFRPIAAVLAIGGKVIVSSTASIVTENWIIAASDGWVWDRLELYLFPSAVFRIAGNRLSWDIGAILPLGYRERDGAYILSGITEGATFPIPILSVTYRVD